MSLAKEIQSWPEHWATCPVYRKGYEIKNDDGSVDIADGKRPLNQSHRSTISPARTALRLEKYPEVFGAAGVFTGPRSRGLVILDVDANLAAIKEKYGADLTGPNVVSTKRNACKYLFIIPEELWHTVSDCSHAFTKQGFEILWGRMGVLAGAYPGKERVGAPEGKYTLTGDLQALPEAPAWLVALMQESQAEKDGRSSHLTGSKQVDLYRNWSWEQRYEICRACLSVIPPEGGGNDLWWQIGAMVHSAGLGDKGLQLWCDWSKRDPEYAQDWEHGNPCEVRWVNFNDRGGKTIRSLIALANEYDPEKRRFQGNDLERLVAETEAATVKIKTAYLDGSEVLSRAKELEEEIEDPALLDQAKHLLGLDAGRRDGAISIDRMLDAHLAYERTKGAGPQPLNKLSDESFDYLIPGLLPKPWTLLIHADGGTGKTAMCQTIAKHLSQAKAFNVHGGMVPVERSRVLWLNGDQNERILRRQFATIGVEDGVDVIGEWDMSWYRRFVKIQKKNKYDLVVIDSLDGCNDSNPYEENRREYAMPLKRLARRNGVDFPACSIVVIHHNTKQGQFRGTSAIRAAVDETWNMRKASVEELVELNVTLNSRIVTVEKSRDDREGQQMLFTLLPSYTYAIGPVPASKTRIKPNTPGQHTLDMLEVMRADRRPWTATEFYEHVTLGGKHRERAIRLGLQKLRDQGLIEQCDPPADTSLKGRPKVYYRAVGTDVPGFTKKQSVDYMHVEEPPKIENACAGTDLNFGEVVAKSPLCQKSGTSTPAGTSVSSETGSTFGKPTFGKPGSPAETPSDAEDLSFGSDPCVNREIAPEVVKKAMDEGWDRWD